MTGDKASDVSDSAGTLWLDVAGRRWSPAMLGVSGVDISQMPVLFEGTAVTGRLRREVAARWGMECVPVAAGGGDNAAGAAGMGAISDGDAILSLGTSGVTFVVTDGFKPNPDQGVHAFCHCLPDRWHLMAVHLSAASCLDWAAVQFGLAGAAEVAELARRTVPGTGSELFLPFLSGERTPHNDPRLKAGFLGMDHDTTPSRLAVAVLEGVAFSHAEGLAALRSAGARIDRLTMIGGGARSGTWGSIFASLFGLPIDYPAQAEVGPAYGAAKLGQLAATGASPEEICTKPSIRETVDPDPDLAARLEDKFARYRSAVPAAGRA
jgi:xylulokinase